MRPRRSGLCPRSAPPWVPDASASTRWPSSPGSLPPRPKATCSAGPNSAHRERSHTGPTSNAAGNEPSWPRLNASDLCAGATATTARASSSRPSSPLTREPCSRARSIVSPSASPHVPDADGPWPLEARRADALVALCAGAVSSDPEPVRATVVVHARAESLLGPLSSAPNAEVERGPVLAPETLRRLACDGSLQVSLDDAHGTPLMLGRRSRTPSAAMVRALRRRDRTCRFPGCERVRYTDAHHVVWWSQGGRTDLSNLVLLCGFHHRLVHEGGWGLRLEPDATVRWCRPNGERFRAGPGPPAGGGS